MPTNITSRIYPSVPFYLFSCFQWTNREEEGKIKDKKSIRKEKWRNRRNQEEDKKLKEKRMNAHCRAPQSFIFLLWFRFSTKSYNHHFLACRPCLLLISSVPIRGSMYVQQRCLCLCIRSYDQVQLVAQDRCPRKKLLKIIAISFQVYRMQSFFGKSDTDRFCALGTTHLFLSFVGHVNKVIDFFNFF